VTGRADEVALSRLLLSIKIQTSMKAADFLPKTALTDVAA
jgi:hypothetical protein